jgi:hypothetical protein
MIRNEFRGDAHFLKFEVLPDLKRLIGSVYENMKTVCDSFFKYRVKMAEIAFQKKEITSSELHYVKENYKYWKDPYYREQYRKRGVSLAVPTKIKDYEPYSFGTISELASQVGAYCMSFNSWDYVDDFLKKKYQYRPLLGRAIAKALYEPLVNILFSNGIYHNNVFSEEEIKAFCYGKFTPIRFHNPIKPLNLGLTQKNIQLGIYYTNLTLYENGSELIGYLFNDDIVSMLQTPIYLIREEFLHSENWEKNKQSMYILDVETAVNIFSPKKVFQRIVNYLIACQVIYKKEYPCFGLLLEYAQSNKDPDKEYSLYGSNLIFINSGNPIKTLKKSNPDYKKKEAILYEKYKTHYSVYKKPLLIKDTQEFNEFYNKL